ncbi:MAG: DNA repair protein RecO [Parvularculaceae bacterium]
MDFIDEGIILSARAHGENHAVADLFTAAHGRWAGLVHGGQGRRMRPILQAGNEVRAEWKGRLNESLGHFTLELPDAHAGELMQDRLSLAALTAACAIASACLPERETHPAAFTAMRILIANLDQPEIWPALMARWSFWAARRTWFRADARPLRRDRSAGKPRLCFAEIGLRGLGGGRRSV